MGTNQNAAEHTLNQDESKEREVGGESALEWRGKKGSSFKIPFNTFGGEKVTFSELGEIVKAGPS